MADEPAVRVTGKGSITLESLTIRWQRAASERVTSPLGAVWVKDTPLTIRSVRFQAPGGNARCPVAIYALGFCDLKLEQCHIEGFEFPVEFSGAHKG
jgi:hypothetical protein